MPPGLVQGRVDAPERGCGDHRRGVGRVHAPLHKAGRGDEVLFRVKTDQLRRRGSEAPVAEV